MKRLINQFARYFGVALIGLASDFGILVFFKEVLNLHYLFAAANGFLVGLMVVYVLSNKFVFSNPKIKSKSWNFIIFGLIGLVGLGLLGALMWFFTSFLGLYYIASKIIATFFVYMWNFFARRSLYHDC